MARDTVRVRRGEGGVDPQGDPRLGYDEALVGGADEQAAQIVIDPSERDNNPYLGSEHDDESWDLPEDQRKKPETPDKQPGTERRAREEQEGGDEEEDVRLAYDEPDEEQRSSRRRRRNQSRRVAIDRRDQTIDELAKANEQLKAMVTNLYGGQFQLSARDIDQRITYHRNAIDRADMEIARAIKEADGDTAVALQRERDKINYDLWQLEGAKRNIEEQAQQLARGGMVDRQQPQFTPEQQQAIQAQEDEYERMRDVFLDRYTWFDPQEGDDPDHDYVKKIDRTLVTEGYQRHTKAFWHEMERRMQRGGFHPEGGRDDRLNGDDDDDRGFETRRNFQSRRNGGNGVGNGQRRPNLPPTGAVRSISRPGRADSGFQLSDIQIDMLRDEDLLRSGLTEAEEAKKTRIIDKWRRGAQQLSRGRN
jgi:hypothetical protein